MRPQRASTPRALPVKQEHEDTPAPLFQSKYQPEFPRLLVEHMEQGGSFEAFAGRVGCARSTVYAWLERHAEFAEAYEIGKAACLAWWEEVLRRQAAHGTGNATALLFALMNRFPDLWKDKRNVEITGARGGPIRVGREKEPDLSKLSISELEQLHAISAKLEQEGDDA
jgi:hypothetical protein